MKKIISLIFTLFTAAILCAAARPSLDGRAVVADEGEMPKGLFARTIGYLPGDSVTVTNPANGSTVDVLILGSIDASEGVAIMLSPQAADRLSIRKDSNVQVKITKRTGSLDENVSGTAVLSDENEEGNYSDDELSETLPVNKTEETLPEEENSEIKSADAETEEKSAEESPVTESEEVPAEIEAEQAETAENETPVDEVPPETEENVEAEAVENDIPPAEDNTVTEPVNEEVPAENEAEPVEAVETEVPVEDNSEAEAVSSDVPSAEEEAEAEKFDEQAPEIAEDVPSENVESEELPSPDEVPAEEAVTEEVPETQEEETEVPVEIEEPVESADAQDSAVPEEYAPIVLVPSEPNPPEESEEAPVEDEAPVAEEVSVETPAPVMSEVTVTSVSDKKIENYVKASENLEKGKYYLQIATLKNKENIESLLNKYADKYPVVLVPNGNDAYRVMVGPLTADEYGMIKERFESYGFKDCFLRKIK